MHANASLFISDVRGRLWKTRKLRSGWITASAWTIFWWLRGKSNSCEKSVAVRSYTFSRCSYDWLPWLTAQVLNKDPCFLTDDRRDIFQPLSFAYVKWTLFFKRRFTKQDTQEQLLVLDTWVIQVRPSIRFQKNFSDRSCSNAVSNLQGLNDDHTESFNLFITLG